MAHKARRRPSWKKRNSKYLEKLKIELAKALRDEIQKEINREILREISDANSTR